MVKVTVIFYFSSNILLRLTPTVVVRKKSNTRPLGPFSRRKRVRRKLYYKKPLETLHQRSYQRRQTNLRNEKRFIQRQNLNGYNVNKHRRRKEIGPPKDPPSILLRRARYDEADQKEFSFGIFSRRGKRSSDEEGEIRESSDGELCDSSTPTNEINNPRVKRVFDRCPW